MYMQDIEPATIIDVRTPAEFNAGHLVGAINFPLTQMIPRLDELKKVPGKIILCCASGVRSKRAYDILQRHGLKNVSDGGSWMALQLLLHTTN
jgi:rhodanese-related sulfurtransferase